MAIFWVPPVARWRRRSNGPGGGVSSGSPPRGGAGSVRRARQPPDLDAAARRWVSVTRTDAGRAVAITSPAISAAKASANTARSWKPHRYSLRLFDSMHHSAGLVLDHHVRQVRLASHRAQRRHLVGGEAHRRDVRRRGEHLDVLDRLPHRVPEDGQLRSSV